MLAPIKSEPKTLYGARERRAVQDGMRKFSLVIVALMLPMAGAFAEQPRLPNSGKAPPSGKLLPLKSARPSNSCADYGAGFVRVEGSNTCVKVGGAISVEAGVSARPR